MVLDVDKLLWKDGTEKYMAGTPNTVGMLGWGATIDYLNKINVFSYNEHIKKLADLLYEYLKNKKEINVYTQDKDTASGIISFNINNIHPHDVNEFFRNENIMVRVGNHCSIPTMRYLGIKSCFIVEKMDFFTKSPPTPNGPSILCAEQTKKSIPMLVKFIL